MTAPDYVAQVAEMLGQHRIECTGMEGVTCRACRDRRWMPMRTFATHQAEVLAAAGLIPTSTEWGSRMTWDGPKEPRTQPRLVSRAVTNWKDASDD